MFEDTSLGPDTVRGPAAAGGPEGLSPERLRE